MKVAICNLGRIVSGDWHDPFVAGDTIVTDAGRIVAVGTANAPAVESADVVIDAGGMTAIPGLIDSHVHVTFGDYTPRQRTVGYLESYLHGGVTTAISASEVHVPGRPRDPEGVKALAVAAQRCFADYRPGGMKVIAGSVILEPGLKASDFKELAEKGVRLAKAGFGAVATSYDYAPLVADARAAGLITTCHTGGSSIPGSGAITGDHLLKIRPHVSFHINGGPTAMPDADFSARDPGVGHGAAGVHRRQPAHHAPVRAARATARRVRPLHHRDRHADRLGIMPLGMLYTIAHLASLTDMPPEQFICAATGNNAKVYRPRLRLPRVRQGRRHRADRRAGRRHAGQRARRHQARRYRGHRRGDHRRHPALRRAQPQHTGHDTKSAGRALTCHAGFRRGGALA